MKNLFKLFVSVVVAATALVACQKEVAQDKVNEDLNAFHITVKAAPEALLGDTQTKTYIDENQTIIWGTGEYMKIGITAGENTAFANSSSESADDWDGEEQAMFQFSVTLEGEAPYLYQGLYPASAAVSSTNTNPANYKVSLPSSQNATASSYDPAAYIMVAKPVSFNELETEWLASYRRATALNKITLKNFNDDVYSVKVIAPEGTNLTGRRHINLSTGESLDVYDGSNEVEVFFATPLAANNGAAKDIWFTSWDVQLESGANVTFIVKSADKSYTKTITVNSNGLKFQEGYLNKLGLSMSGISGEEIDDLSGDYLIGSYVNNTWVLMSSSCNKNYASQTTTVSKAFSELVYTDFDSDVDTNDYIWHVSKTDNGYTIQSENTDAYVEYHGSSNEAYAATEVGSGVYFNIEIDEDNVATIESKNVAGRQLKYNSGSPRFAFYTSGQQSVYLIPAEIDNRTKVTLSFSEVEVAKNTENYSSFTGQTVSVDPNVAAVSESIVYSIEGEIGSIDSSTGVVTLNGATGSATVTASFAGDENYKQASATYSIVVTEVGASADWELVTDFDSIVSGDKYMFVATYNNKDYYLSSASATAGNTKAVELSGDPLSIGFETIDNMWFILNGDTDGFTLTNADGNTAQLTNNNNGLAIVSGTGTSFTFQSGDTGLDGTIIKGPQGDNTRYVGLYQGVNFRTYTTVNANIKASTGYRWYHYIGSSESGSGSGTESGSGSYTLDSEAIASAHSSAWAYTSGTKYITAADGSVWTAVNTFGNTGQVTLQLNTGKNGYVATPVVSGKITKITVELTSTNSGTGTGTRAMNILDGNGNSVAASVPAADLISGYSISGDYTQLRLDPTGATYIKSITIDYE